MRFLFGLLALASLSSAALAGCNSKSCTTLGCESTMTSSLDVPVMASGLDGKILQVCHGQRCAKADLAVREGRLVCSYVSGDNEARASCEPTIEPIANGVRIRPQYHAAYKEKVANGESFTVRLTDVGGATLAQGGGTAADVRSFFPNGKECDEDEGLECHQGRF